MQYTKVPIFFFILIVISSLFLGCNLIGGAYEHEPQDLQKKISSGARALMEQAFEGIDPSQLRDYHTHMLGMNTELNGNFVNEGWQSPLNGLVHYIQFEVYKSAAGITNIEQADEQYLARLKNLIQYIPQHGKFGIMAFDYFHDEEGNPIKELSTFRVTNRYVMEKVRENPDLFFPIISIHPASKNMNDQLEAYYRVMHNYDMTLISHTGDEKATEAEEFQNLGNPLFLKKPLDMGVKVVMAHVASLGECKEEDAEVCTPETPYIDLAIKMLEEPKYQDLLFADISALTQDNRKDNLNKVLEKESIHSNLINGSDYPLPAVNIVIQTRTLESAGYITEEERESLNEIYDFNPLLFDFVLKRTLRHTETGTKLPASVFLEHPKLPTS